MSVPFKVIQRPEPGVVGGGIRKYYAKLVPARTLTLTELASDIADNTTVSETDAYAVLKALEKQIPKQLSRGFAVKLGDFGSFRLGISSEGRDLEDEITAYSIKKARFIFSPGQYLKTMLLSMTFVKESEPAEPVV